MIRFIIICAIAIYSNAAFAQSSILSRDSILLKMKRVAAWYMGWVLTTEFMKRTLRKIGLIIVAVSCCLTSVYGQDTVNVTSQTPKKPMPWFFIDEKPIEGSFMSKVKADEIAILQVLPLNKAIELHGDKGKHGVTYIFTKPYCSSQYKKAFSSRSAEYKKVLKDEGGSDARIQYILDGKVLKENFEGRLFAIRNNPSYYVKIIESEGLELYGVNDKVYGFVITKRVN